MIVNATPHDITIIQDDNRKIVIKHTIVLRVKSTVMPSDYIDGITIFSERMGNVIGIDDIPNNADGIIVSRVVADALPDEIYERLRVFVPDTSNAVRDSNGKIIGVPGLIEYKKCTVINGKHRCVGDELFIGDRKYIIRYGHALIPDNEGYMDNHVYGFFLEDDRGYLWHIDILYNGGEIDE